MRNVPATILILSLALVSCSSGSRVENKGKSAGEVMSEYTETLSKAPSRALAVADLEEKRNASQDEAMKELDKSGN